MRPSARTSFSATEWPPREHATPGAEHCKTTELVHVSTGCDQNRESAAINPAGLSSCTLAHPDWFEAIHLYGTESGWDGLKELVEAYQDADARHQAFVELIAPAARNIHAYWLARRAAARDTIDDTRRPIHKVLVPGRNDPCLCGSGKKFKHCHGALKLLH